jgi:ParB-like chromosome segregation protein Spo0J
MGGRIISSMTLMRGDQGKYDGLAQEFASPEFAAHLAGTLPKGFPGFKYIHPFANLLPMMAEEQRPAFRASLSERQIHPALLHRGLLADGRNRARDLIELKKPIDCLVFEGTDYDLLQYLKAENIERRHLTIGQLADYAARVARLPLGANRFTIGASREAPILPLAGEPTSSEGKDIPATIMSQTDAANMYGVSRSTVQRYAVVLDKGAPELQGAVQRGTVTVNDAMEIATLPIEEQKKIIAAADPKIVKEVAKKNRTEKQKVSRQKRLDKMRDPDATPLLSGGETVGLFYVDIPREFVAWSDDTGMEKSPENHYRTEGFDFLANMRDQILARAKPNSVMVMWAWANSLQDQLDLMTEWGFASARRRDEQGLLLRGPDGRILPPVGEGRYRTHQIWAKRAANGNLHQGTGFWFRDCHELLLVGCRGDVPAPLEGKQALSIIDAVKGVHSEKPNDIVREMLDRYFEGVPKLEMFGRVDDPAAFKARWPLWEVWGNHGLQVPAREAAE